MKTNPNDIIYSSQQAAKIGVDYLQWKRDNKGGGIPLYIPAIDVDFIPAMPTELITIIGRPGNGKTGLMVWWARRRMRKLLELGITDRTVVYCSLEQTVEELQAFHIAADQRMSITSMARGEITDAEWDRVLGQSVKYGGYPFDYIGHSIVRRKSRPRIDMDAMTEAALQIEKRYDSPIGIDMLFVDYLQRIPLAKGVESKTIGTSENLDRLKDLALTLACPVVVGVQAGREVDNTDSHIPGLSDGQWTSNIEQTSDKVISLMRPRKYYDPGVLFGKKGQKEYVVSGRDQMVITILKQKLGPDNMTYMVKFDLAYNKLDELEEEKSEEKQGVML